MEKVDYNTENIFVALASLGLGFDDIAKEKASKQLSRCSLVNSLSVEESELLMFLLSQSIMN